MSPLLEIPLELLVEISSYLTTPDFASLRLTCTTIERSLWDWFAQEFFVKKQFMITRPSLQALVDISHHERLSKILKHVIISTLLYEPGLLADRNMPQFRDNAEADLLYVDVVGAQTALIQHGIHRDMLVEAFKGLDHLEIVDLRDFEASRPRDGIRWNSWGARTIYLETGRHPVTFADHTEQGSVGQLFSTLLYALGLADRRIPRLSVPIRNPVAKLSDGSFYLPEAFFPAVEPVLLGLDVLHLALSMQPYGDTWLPHADGEDFLVHSSRCLRHFLYCTSTLKELRLNFLRDAHGANSKFLEWLAAPPLAFFDGPHPTRSRFEGTPPIKLPQLVVLEIGQLEIDPGLLLAVIAKFAPTLERIALQRIGLTYNERHTTYHTTRLWKQFFLDLAFVPLPLLRYFSLVSPRMTNLYGPFRRHPVDFRDGAQFLEHSGPDMPGFFRQLVQDSQELVVR